MKHDSSDVERIFFRLFQFDLVFSWKDKMKSNKTTTDNTLGLFVDYMLGLFVYLDVGTFDTLYVRTFGIFRR